MSKRYGRNQKRHNRQEIARLQHELDLAITGGFARATGKWPALDPLIGVPISIDINDSEDGFTIQRTARIRFLMMHEDGRKAIAYHLAYSGAVDWRGIVWAAKTFRPVHSDVFAQDTIIELELQAIGDRDQRRAATIPYLPALDFKRHRRISI